MGLNVSVYRAADRQDCTNGGISSRFSTLCVMNVEGPFNPSDRAAPVVLRKHPTMNAVHLVPAYFNVKEQRWEPVPGHFMMGGNYGATSDSRFGDTVRRMYGIEYTAYICSAVSIHDRQE